MIDGWMMDVASPSMREREGAAMPCPARVLEVVVPFQGKKRGRGSAVVSPSLEAQWQAVVNVGDGYGCMMTDAAVCQRHGVVRWRRRDRENQLKECSAPGAARLPLIDVDADHTDSSSNSHSATDSLRVPAAAKEEGDARFGTKKKEEIGMIFQPQAFNMEYLAVY